MQIGDTDSIGAVKIKDGLFMGDVYAAQVFSFYLDTDSTIGPWTFSDK